MSDFQETHSNFTELQELDEFLKESQNLQKEFSTLKKLAEPINLNQQQLTTDLSSQKENMISFQRKTTNLSTQLQTQRIQHSPRALELSQKSNQQQIKLSMLQNQLENLLTNPSILQNHKLQLQNFMNDQIQGPTQAFMQNLSQLVEHYQLLYSDIDAQIDQEKSKRLQLSHQVEDMQNQLMEMCNQGGNIDGIKSEIIQTRDERDQLQREKESLMEELKQMEGHRNAVFSGSFASNDAE
eukprot:403337388